MSGHLGGSMVSQLQWEQRSYWRNPAAAAFTFAFPLMFLVVFTAINGNEQVELSGHQVPFAQIFVPGILAFGVVSACYTNLAFILSHRRDTGILKRVRGTPLKPLVYLAGIGLNVVVVATILSALVIGLGIVAYGITFPDRYLGLVVTIAIAALTFAAIGALVSTVVPNEDAAPAIVNFLLFPILFISGTFGRVDDGTTLARIADVFPVRHLNEQLIDVFDPAGGGTGISANHTLVLLVWAAGAGLLAARRFRWDARSK
jgi:ABC-2 type transport system permease protein